MKKSIFLTLIALAATLVFTNCNSNEEDLTTSITGEYIGGFGSNSGGSINPYTIVVTKVDNNRINIKPKTGTAFEAFETDLVKINSSTLNSPTDNNQQLETLVTVSLGIPVTISFQKKVTNDVIVFQGQKQ